MNKRVFSLIMVGILAAGLLVGCGSNSEEAKNDHMIQAEQTTAERKLEEESDAIENVVAEDAGI